MQRIVMHRMARLTRGLCLVLGLLGALSAAGETRDFSGGLTLQKYGSGEMRRFGFLVYEAQLWAAANPSDPPIALQLTYKRDIAGARIVDAASIRCERSALMIVSWPIGRSLCRGYSPT